MNARRLDLIQRNVLISIYYRFPFHVLRFQMTIQVHASATRKIWSSHLIARTERSFARLKYHVLIAQFHKGHQDLTSFLAEAFELDKLKSRSFRPEMDQRTGRRSHARFRSQSRLTSDADDGHAAPVIDSPRLIFQYFKER
jgi:hypothetical protein